MNDMMEVIEELTDVLYEGRYLTLRQYPKSGNIVFVLTDDGREEIGRMLEDGKYPLLGTDSLLFELGEDIFCNSAWEGILPEEIGAVTSSTILCDNAVMDDDGDIIEIGDVWWDCGPMSCYTFLYRLQNAGYIDFYIVRENEDA